MSVLVHAAMLMLLASMALAIPEFSEPLLITMLPQPENDLDPYEVTAELTLDVPIASIEFIANPAPFLPGIDPDPELRFHNDPVLDAPANAPEARIAVGRRTESQGTVGIPAEFLTRQRREGAGTGDVQVSLIWGNGNDLDLYVRCPNGQVIWFIQRTSQDGGRLDVDMNADGPMSQEPIENVFWPSGRAPEGTYHVGVHHFANHGFGSATPFKVLVKIGESTQVFENIAIGGQPPLPVCSFDHTRTTAPPTFRSRADSIDAPMMVNADPRAEKAAGKMLERARHAVARRSRTARTILNSLIQRYPDSEAAKEGRSLLLELQNSDP